MQIKPSNQTQPGIKSVKLQEITAAYLQPQARSSIRFQGILVCRYSCMSLQYFDKWHCYGNHEDLLCIRRHLLKIDRQGGLTN